MNKVIKTAIVRDSKGMDHEFNLVRVMGGYTFTWDELEGASGHGIAIKSYRGDYLAIDGIAEVLEANLAYDHKVVSADLGAFIDTVIA